METISALFAVAGRADATLDYELRYFSLRNENNCAQVEAGNTLRCCDADCRSFCVPSLTTLGEVYVNERHIKPQSYIFERQFGCYTGQRCFVLLCFFAFSLTYEHW